ncbi:hypothetical protein [Halopseudomonas salina]|uniref:hypothetical protein n=1 Tax=Halopseudomonas salina TaxID=1323744 RepID=UPI00168031EB|nr:hypothetical protein [Halopseudomonas salina]
MAACADSEKAARTLLNQAIQQWDRGELELALGTFDRIGTQYLDTVAATEAIKERAVRLDTYRAASSTERNRAINSGVVSRHIYQQVESYFDRTGHYPELLHGDETVYQGQFDAFVSYCTYQKSILEYGYQLDCTRADSVYVEARKQRLREAVQKPHSVKSTASVEDRNASAIKTAADLSPAQSSWGEHANPSGALPEDGFQAFYINTNQPRQVIATESVGGIAINYIRDDFHGIESGDFGGYWVGMLEFKQQEVMSFTVSQSWSKTRILINGRVLFEGGSDQSILYRFEPGEHKIEVEYVNNWHTTEFSVGIHSSVTYLDMDQIKMRLQANLLDDFQVLYAGLYESSARDMTTIVNLEKTADPVVLVLSSYSPVKWYVSNPFGVEIRAIVYGAYKPGSTLAGDIPGSILRLPAKTRIGSYHVSPDCRCVAGSFHCEGKGKMPTVTALQTLTNKTLSGFTGHYSAESLTVPEVRVDACFLEELTARMSRIEMDRAACKAENNPDFERMFEG